MQYIHQKDANYFDRDVIEGERVSVSNDCVEWTKRARGKEGGKKHFEPANVQRIR